MTLTEAMQRDLNSSEIEVFRTIIAQIISVQKQLDTLYHGDRYLRDRLLTTVNIPVIRDALRDLVPRTAHQLINGVANRMSDKPKTAGLIMSHFVPEHSDGNNEAMYMLGRKFGG